jgi:hypothetical protein
MQALLGSASHFCEEVVLKLKTETLYPQLINPRPYVFEVETTHKESVAIGP